jgi:hypothetical protein
VAISSEVATVWAREVDKQSRGLHEAAAPLFLRLLLVMRRLRPVADLPPHHEAAMNTMKITTTEPMRAQAAPEAEMPLSADQDPSSLAAKMTPSTSDTSR